MGMHGWKHVNRAIQSADLLIAIGMRFDDRVTGNVRTYAPYARIIHVDIDPAEIGKNVAVEVPIVGDAGRVLQRPHPDGPRDLGRRAPRVPRPAGRLEARLRGLLVARLGAWRDGVLSADYVVERIGELTDHQATYVADVGQNQMWLARYTGFRNPNSPRLVGRPRDDGLLRPRRRWARRSADPTARPGRSPATAASR